MIKLTVNKHDEFDSIYNYAVANFKSTALTREFWFDVLSQHLQFKLHRFRPILLINCYDANPKIWLSRYEEQVVQYVDEADITKALLDEYSSQKYDSVGAFIFVNSNRFKGLVAEGYGQRLFKALYCAEHSISTVGFDLLRTTLREMNAELSENNFNRLLKFNEEAHKVDLHA